MIVASCTLALPFLVVSAGGVQQELQRGHRARQRVHSPASNPSRLLTITLTLTTNPKPNPNSNGHSLASTPRRLLTLTLNPNPNPNLNPNPKH